RPPGGGGERGGVPRIRSGVLCHRAGALGERRHGVDCARPPTRDWEDAMKRRRLLTHVAVLAALAALPARVTPALLVSAAQAAADATSDTHLLIDPLGVPVAARPVRERPGWRPPRIVLVSKPLHDVLPVLQ